MNAGTQASDYHAWLPREVIQAKFPKILKPLGERQRGRVPISSEQRGGVQYQGHLGSKTGTGHPTTFLPQSISPENHPRKTATYKFCGILQDA